MTSTLGIIPTQRWNGLIIRSTIVPSLGGLLFGFDTAVISGITQAITAKYSLTPLLLGWTVAAMVVLPCGKNAQPQAFVGQFQITEELFLVHGCDGLHGKAGIDTYRPRRLPVGLAGA
jgi:hypothetical protein